MDITIESNLKGFSESFGFEKLDTSEQFERFCLFSIVSKEAMNSLSRDDIEAMSVKQNKGIDGICVLAGGKTISSISEVEDLISSEQSIVYDIFFIQSKTSAKFEEPQINSFLETIIDFLNKTPKYPMTEEARNYREIYELLMANKRFVSKLNIYAYYCSLGKWEEDETIKVTIESKKQFIENTFVPESLEIKALDKNNLLLLFKRANNPLSANFEFSNRIPVKGVKGVKEAYIGLVPFSSFKNLIIDPVSGNLRSLFDDNVRDFLGIDNKVNEKIKRTIINKEFFEFALLNNGITVIASDNKGRMDEFILENYQIVNGCQTSNVLYALRDENIDDTLIPIKLVITQDEALRDKIIFSTNNQSGLNEENLFVITKFQKDLEDFYKHSTDGIYYERRIKQYAGLGIKRKSITDLREQIKSFVAMFLNVPQDVSGYFSRVYQKRKNEIFVEGQLYEPYYVAGLTQFKFKELLANKKIDKKYNKARYHIYMLFRLITESEEFKTTFLSTRKKKAYFDELLKILRDDKKCLYYFEQAIQVINKSKIDVQDQKEIYKKNTTLTLINTYNNIFNQNNDASN